MPFTAPQSKSLAGKLDAKHVRTREHDGHTLSYIEGWHAITEANQIFGFDSWDRETIVAQCIWEGRKLGRCACAYSARVRVRVRAGETVVVREGCGVGHGLGDSPGLAHESALKEAETDAMKRALMTFGNRFGLALYDRQQNGVRGRISSPTKRSRGPRPIQIDPVIQGAVVETHAEAKDYCSALRKALELAQTPEELRATWDRNASSVAILSSAFPELMTPRGAHYAEVLTLVFERRLKELGAPPESRPVNELAGSTIDKSVLEISVPKRVRDPAHLKFLAAQPCLVCGRTPSQAHHLGFAQLRAMSRKASDEWTVPLCVLHHRAAHAAGVEESWWKELGIDPIAQGQRFWSETRSRGQLVPSGLATVE